MKAKKVFENIEFERGKDPKDALQIGHWSIKRALLDQPEAKVDTMEGDAQRDWWENGGIPEEFKYELEYNESDPLSFTDFVGFDEDWYVENELPDWVDKDRFLNGFTPIERKRSRPNTNGWGTFQWQRGKLLDGTVVYHYIDGMGSGFITRKEWLKPNK